MSQHHHQSQQWSSKQWFSKQWIFDRWAPVYDFPLTSVFYQALHLRLLPLLSLPEHPHVLDLGCGTGKLLHRLSAHNADLTAVGLDLSPEMIHQAQKSNIRNNRNPERLQYKQGNAEALPFEAEQFDGVFSTISFLHYPEPEAVLREIRRVLKPQGRFYLVDFAPRWAEEPWLLAQAASTIRLYGPKVREQLGDRTHLPVLNHQYLLGPVMLTVFGTGTSD